MIIKRLTQGAVMAAALVMTASCGSGSCDSGKTSGNGEPSSNKAIENIMTRTSVREYDPARSISADTVETLLKAAMAAPTAVNRQPWAYVVINDRDSLDSLAEALPYAKMLRQAPLAIVTCGDLDKAFEGEPSYWIQDVSASTENLLLAANALGLGAVWTGVYPTQERVKAVSETLGLPSNIVPLAVVPIGYPAREHTPKDKWNPEAVHYNHW